MITRLIKEQYPEIVSCMERFPHPMTFDIGFINPTIPNMQGDGIANDETEFTVGSLKELEELYTDFCEENFFPEDTVKYVELVG
jgi:hypothetical protein